MNDIKFCKGRRYIKAYKEDKGTAGWSPSGRPYRDAFAFYDKKYGIWFDAYSWIKPSRTQTPKVTAEYLNVLLASYK